MTVRWTVRAAFEKGTAHKEYNRSVLRNATVPYFLSSNSILTKYIKQGKIKSRKAIQTAAIKIGRNLNGSSETFLDI